MEAGVEFVEREAKRSGEAAKRGRKEAARARKRLLAGLWRKRKSGGGFEFADPLGFAGLRVGMTSQKGRDEGKGGGTIKISARVE